MADFQSLRREFDTEEIKIITASVDTLDKTEEYVAKVGFTYPVAYGLNAEEVSALTGAYFEKDKRFLHATGFLVRPDNTIEVAVYSTGPIGRFKAQDVLNLVKYYKSLKK